MGVGASFEPEFPGASVIPTDHFWSGRKSHPVKWVVVHGTAGSTRAADVATYFQTNSPPTSTHYIVGLDGEVVQCVKESDTAWGNGIVTKGADPWWNPNDNPNYSTISIEHVKPNTDNSNWLTEPQRAASFKLIAYLVRKYNIAPQASSPDGGIAAHNQIDPVDKIRCPGGYPWGDLFTYLQAPELHDLNGKITQLGQELVQMQQANVSLAADVQTAQQAQKETEAALVAEQTKAANDLEVAQVAAQTAAQEAAGKYSSLVSQYNELVTAMQTLTGAKAME